MAFGVVVNSIQDVLAVASQTLESAKDEICWLVPPSLLSLSTRYGFTEKIRAFTQQGGTSRGIVPLLHANVEEVWTRLDIGEDVRHAGGVHEIYMFVADRRQSISAINIGIGEFALDTPVTAFWSDDPTYAEYLLASFENAWSQAVPAKERVQELLKHSTRKT